jgi:hypothetical protein
MAFGQPVNTTYRFDLAQRVLSLDCDFLSLQLSRVICVMRAISWRDGELLKATRR